VKTCWLGPLKVIWGFVLGLPAKGSNAAEERLREEMRGCC